MHNKSVFSPEDLVFDAIGTADTTRSCAFEGGEGYLSTLSSLRQNCVLMRPEPLVPSHHMFPKSGKPASQPCHLAGNLRDGENENAGTTMSCVLWAPLKCHVCSSRAFLLAVGRQTCARAADVTIGALMTAEKCMAQLHFVNGNLRPQWHENC